MPNPKLFIVEAPGKVKKLQSYLGPGYKVMASAGHIRDLPKKDMGVSAPDFVPTYEVTKTDVVARLRTAVKSADEVILATDLDREGEAIAWHLKEVLRLKNPRRVTYSEISKKALQDALANAGYIDTNMVQAQEGRRILDRLVGYRVSGALCQMTGMRLSAGRVQTPAIMLLVNREREIQNFVATSHFGVRAHFLTAGKEWTAEWDFRPVADKDQKYWTDEAFAKQVAGLNAFSITQVDKKETKRMPPAPFTTSTLQQAASSALGLRPKQTMELAQKLYESGLITYHRTDSMNMAQDAVEAIWKQLRAMGMNDYVPTAMNTWKAKENAQEAHECIRPTNFADKHPAEAPDAKALKLYELIWKRAMAAQMKPQVCDVTTVQLLTKGKTDGYGNKQQVFIAKGSVEKFPGWKAIYQTDDEKDDQALPALSQGQQLTAEEMELQAKKTQPPPRYTEASLVKKLEDEGIGRPSTYASIIETIYAREYARDEKKKLVPTDIAFKVVDALAGKFSFADLPYTRQVEEDLDLIASGKKTYKGLITTVNGQLDQELKGLNGVSGVGAALYPCPAPGCGGHLRRAVAKQGTNKGKSFWACNKYPDCKETRPDADGKPGERGQAVKGDERFPCPDCGKPMALRDGKKGKFWGCTGYPDCKTILDDNKGKPATRHLCPDCGKPLRRLQATKGDNQGKYFWGCTGFREGCKYSAQDVKGKPQ